MTSYLVNSQDISMLTSIVSMVCQLLYQHIKAHRWQRGIRVGSILHEEYISSELQLDSTIVFSIVWLHRFLISRFDGRKTGRPECYAQRARHFRHSFSQLVDGDENSDDYDEDDEDDDKDDKGENEDIHIGTKCEWDKFLFKVENKWSSILISNDELLYFLNDKSGRI